MSKWKQVKTYAFRYTKGIQVGHWNFSKPNWRISCNFPLDHFFVIVMKIGHWPILCRAYLILCHLVRLCSRALPCFKRWNGIGERSLEAACGREYSWAVDKEKDKSMPIIVYFKIWTFLDMPKCFQKRSGSARGLTHAKVLWFCPITLCSPWT